MTVEMNHNEQGRSGVLLSRKLVTDLLLIGNYFCKT